MDFTKTRVCEICLVQDRYLDLIIVDSEYQTGFAGDLGVAESISQSTLIQFLNPILKITQPKGYSLDLFLYGTSCRREHVRYGICLRIVQQSQNGNP